MNLHPGTEGRGRVAGDVLLVAGLAGAMFVELWQADRPDTEMTPLSVTVIVLATLPVLVRRQRPWLALVLAMVMLYVVMVTVDIYQTVPFPSMVAGYTLALTYDRRTTILAGLALVPPVIGAIAIFGHDDVLFRTAEIPKNMAFIAAPLLLGSAVRERRAHVSALVERAENAERTREEEALRRVGEERLRIARDVHDVVAHAMVAINVQAGVGAHLLDRDPEQARRTLLDIKKLSGEALHDLRATIGTLRADDDETAPVRPAQSLRELEELGDSLRSAGIEVDLDIDPATATLPAAVTATGYRIVQEALTNVVRHARGSRASVRVAREDDRVVIDVTDDGGELAPALPDGTGNGVRGMRERAQAAGGTLEAGPRADGGWRVLASLPGVPVTIRVLLADDQTLVRAGFRALLESEDDIEVVGEAVDGLEAVTLATETRPDVVLMDIRMPHLDGLEATTQITADPALSGTRVLVLTTFELDEYVFGALRAGASGFLLKDVEPVALIDAVRVIADGQALLAPAVTLRLIEAFVSSSPEPDERPAPSPAAADADGVLAGLTPREREILALVGRGMTNQEIAEHLVLSPLTAKTHVSRLFLKLGVRDRAQLVVTAYETGLVIPPARP